MSRYRWLFFIISIALGLGAGLYYGWVVSPVEYTDTAPSSLRADFRADFTLMVAESYQKDHDIDKAARRLAQLSSQSPLLTASEALNFAKQYHFNPVDISLLENLNLALQVRQTGGVQPGGVQP